MIKKLSVTVCFLLFLSSCYTIHFKRTASSEMKDYQITKWHHIGLFGLMEFSSPVNLKAMCPKDSWQAVRTQTGFLQGLVRSLFIPLGSLGSLYGSSITVSRGSYYHKTSIYQSIPINVSVGQFYSPEEVSVSCGNN